MYNAVRQNETLDNRGQPQRCNSANHPSRAGSEIDPYESGERYQQDEQNDMDHLGHGDEEIDVRALGLEQFCQCENAGGCCDRAGFLVW